MLAVVGVNQFVAGAEGVSVAIGGDSIFYSDVPVRVNVIFRYEIATVSLVLIGHGVVLVYEIALYGVEPCLVVVHVEPCHPCRNSQRNMLGTVLDVLV